MPTYQYRCPDCGHRFEAVQAFTDDALTSCPECAGRLRKVYGSIGIVFKGSGFYRTDSRASATDGKPATPAKDGAAAASTSTSDKTGGSSSGSDSSTASSAGSTSTAKPAASSGAGAGGTRAAAS